VQGETNHGQASGWRPVAPLALALAFFAAALPAGAQQRGKAAPTPQVTEAEQAQAITAAQGRTEILTYDNWTVTCRDGRDPKEKRACSAELTIFQDAGGGQRRAVFAWVMGLNKDNQLTSAMRFLPGISVAPGVELKFADKTPRRVPIVTCEPSHCEATTPMDDGFIREGSQVIQAEAIVTASDGRQVTFTINMKGFSQAVAAVRR
jgi:invasion protein IalB